MDGDLTVELDALGRAGPRLAALAARVANDPGAGPALAGTAAGWATTAALEELGAAAILHLRWLADGIEAAGVAVTATAEAYADADDRAAGRLRGTR